MTEETPNSGNDKHARMQATLAQWAAVQAQTGTAISKIMEQIGPSLSASAAAGKALQGLAASQPEAGIVRVPVQDARAVTIPRVRHMTPVIPRDPAVRTNGLLETMIQGTVALQGVAEKLVAEMEAMRDDKPWRKTVEWWVVVISSTVAVVAVVLQWLLS